MTTTIEHADDAELERKLVAILRVKGYCVDRWTRMETPKQFLARLGVRHPTTFTRKTRHPKCPAFLHTTGPTGRIIYLQSNPELERFFTT